MEVSRSFSNSKENITVTIPPIATKGINDFDVNDLLRNLGYSENAIQKMPLAEKQKFLQATNFNSEVAVIKTDIEGNQTEAEALAEIKDNETSIQPYGMVDKEDSYMKIVLTSAFHAFQPDRWLFYFNAEWLQRPIERGIDVIGITAPPITIKPNTISGYLMADKYTYVSGMQPQMTTITNLFDSTSDNLVYSGMGAAYKVDLPNDVMNPFGTADIMYDRIIVFMSFEGTISAPSIEQTFNTIGTYAHQYTEIGLSVNISFNDFGISLTGNSKYELRQVITDDIYTPA